MAKINTQLNVVDLLTKGFDAGRFQYLCFDTKKIDWNDPSVLRYHSLKMKPKSITQAEAAKKIDWNDPSVLRYHSLKMKPKSIAQARSASCFCR
ncbi:hypothetical protein Tco_1027388 [Tanacetum coccineum]